MGATIDDLNKIDNVPTPTPGLGLVLGKDGKIPASVLRSNVQHNGVAVATEPAINFIDATGNAFTVADDAANKRVNVTSQASVWRLLQRSAGVSVTNNTAETTVFSVNVPALAVGTTGALRVKLLGSFLNNTGAAQDFTRFRLYCWPTSGGAILAGDTGSIGAGAGVGWGAYSIWTMDVEVWANGASVGYMNMRLNGTCIPGAAHTGGTFVAGPGLTGQWDVNGANVYALGSNGACSIDNTNGWSFAVNIINYTATPDYQTNMDIAIADLVYRA